MRSTTSLTLLDELRAGRDPHTWATFLQTYLPLMTGFAKRLGLSDDEAADAVQEALLAVYSSFREAGSEAFDRSKGRFRTWLCGILLHKVRDVQRRRQGPAVGDAELVQVAANDDAADVFEREWRRNLLERALARVARETDPAVYQAFELYAVRGMPPGNVAKVLGISRNAVYISKTRVLQRLRCVLAELIAEED